MGFCNKNYRIDTKIIEKDVNALLMLHTVAIGDINGDGRPDIVTSNIWIPGESKERIFRVRWYRNGDWKAYDIYEGPDEGARVWLCDLTGNGRLDVIRASRFGNTISWFESPENPECGCWTEHIIDEFKVAHDLYMADIDDDGEEELIAGAINEEGGVLFWYKIPKDPRGKWERRVIDSEINRTTAGDHWGGHGLDVVDIDKDGYLDVLTTSMGEGQFLWYQNPGPPFTGEWKKHVIGGSVEEGTSCLIRAADLYGDGQLQVLGGGEHSMGSGENYTPENDKLMIFTPNDDIYEDYWKQQVIDRPGEVHDIRTVDLDSDGLLEILVANRIQNRLLCYDYDGNRWNRIVLDDQIQTSEIAVADVDGDGQIEVVAVGLRTADVKMYKFIFE